MIYADNSASTFFKPDCVINAVTNAIRFLPANPGRSGHSLSLKGARLVENTRRKLLDYLGADGEVIFTANCTDALNLAILGTIERGHVITSVYEHNSVLRPLFHLKRLGRIALTVVAPKRGLTLTVDDFLPAFQRDTVAVVVTHVSNVTGAISPLFKLGELCRSRGVLFIVDGAQSVGYTTVDMKKTNIDMLALAPHKGLHAVQGVGALVVRGGVKLNPIRFGGTGTSSLSLTQPTDFPDGYESGTLPTPAIAGLNSAISWCEKNDLQNKRIMQNLGEYLFEKLSAVAGVKIFQPENALHGLLSFSVPSLPSDYITEILSNEYDICARGGIHCAPLTHRFLSSEKTGLTRLSLGIDNTTTQIDYIASAIAEITKKH